MHGMHGAAAAGLRQCAARDPTMTRSLLLAAIAPALAVLLLSPGCTAPAAAGPQLRRSLPLPDVAGRIDHLAFDAASERLFVACLGAGCVQVLDLRQGRSAGRIDGLAEPQGIAVGGSPARVYVACGGDGSVRAFDAATLQPLGSVAAGGDADNVRWDADARRLWVGCDGSLAVLGTEPLAAQGRIALPGHAEGFQLEPHGGRVFVNVPGGGSGGAVLVADRERAAVTATWPLRAAGNFPMALVPGQQLVLSICRRPAVLLALDAQSGEELARVPCSADGDDLFVDAARGNVLVIGGGSGGDDGLDVIAMPRRGELRPLARVPLPAGARTGLFVPERRTLFVAAPRAGDREAQILEFAVD